MESNESTKSEQKKSKKSNKIFVAHRIVKKPNGAEIPDYNTRDNGPQNSSYPQRDSRQTQYQENQQCPPGYRGDTEADNRDRGQNQSPRGYNSQSDHQSGNRFEQSRQEYHQSNYDERRYTLRSPNGRYHGHHEDDQWGVFDFEKEQPFQNNSYRPLAKSFASVDRYLQQESRGELTTGLQWKPSNRKIVENESSGVSNSGNDRDEDRRNASPYGSSYRSAVSDSRQNDYQSDQRFGRSQQENGGDNYSGGVNNNSVNYAEKTVRREQSAAHQNDPYRPPNDSRQSSYQEDNRNFQQQNPDGRFSDRGSSNGNYNDRRNDMQHNDRGDGHRSDHSASLQNKNSHLSRDSDSRRSSVQTDRFCGQFYQEFRGDTYSNCDSNYRAEDQQRNVEQNQHTHPQNNYGSETFSNGNGYESDNRSRSRMPQPSTNAAPKTRRLAGCEKFAGQLRIIEMMLADENGRAPPRTVSRSRSYTPPFGNPEIERQNAEKAAAKAAKAAEAAKAAKAAEAANYQQTRTSLQKLKDHETDHALLDQARFVRDTYVYDRSTLLFIRKMNKPEVVSELDKMLGKLGRSHPRNNNLLPRNPFDRRQRRTPPRNSPAEYLRPQFEKNGLTDQDMRNIEHHRFNISSNLKKTSGESQSSVSGSANGNSENNCDKPLKSETIAPIAPGTVTISVDEHRRLIEARDSATGLHNQIRFHVNALNEKKADYNSLNTALMNAQGHIETLTEQIKTVQQMSENKNELNAVLAKQVEELHKQVESLELQKHYADCKSRIGPITSTKSTQTMEEELEVEQEESQNGDNEESEEDD